MLGTFAVVAAYLARSGSGATRAGEATLLDAVPILRVPNLEQSLRFYRDQLGFTLEWMRQCDATKPRLAMVRRDSVRFLLTEHPVAPIGAAVYCDVQGVDAFAASARQNGVTLALEPTDQPWGRREAWL